MQGLKSGTQRASGPASTKMRAPEAAALGTTRASAEAGTETGEETEGGKGNPHPRRMAEADADKLDRC